VYALGVVLYELATTTRLFTGGDAEVIEQIVHGQVESPEVRRPGLSSELAAVILRAIAPDPDERYATCNELRIALDQIAGKTVRPTPAALAGYLREQFGEPLEPWLSPGGSAAGAAVPVSTNTWTETPSGEAQARGVSRPIPTAGLGDIAPPDGAPVRHSTSGVLGEVELAAPLHASPVESLAGEAASSPTARRTRPRAARAGAYGAPIVLIAGIAVWRLAGTGGASAQVSVAPRVEPSAAATEPAPGESATSLGTQVIAVARDPAPRMPGAAAAPPPAARPPPAVTVKSRSAAAAPHHEAVAATTPAAPRLAEPEPAAPAAAEHPALASLPQVAAPLPLAVPAAPVAPMVIAPQALDANRIAGVHDIAPDSATELQIQRSGTDRVVASFQLCVSPDGSVSGVTAVRSTGFAAFDAKITTAIRETWRYRPFLVDGAPATVCSKVNFGYAPKP
jgi:hypothetical protein